LKTCPFDNKTCIIVFEAGSFDIKTGRPDMMTNSFVTVTNRSVSNASIIDNKTSGFDMMLSRLVFVADAFV